LLEKQNKHYDVNSNRVFLYSDYLVSTVSSFGAFANLKNETHNNNQPCEREGVT
jgi:hypothetical protein